MIKPLGMAQDRFPRGFSLVIHFTPGFFSNAPHGAPDEFSTAIDGISPLVLKPKNEQERGNWGFQVTTKYLHL
jgi:hypothetical protein